MANLNSLSISITTTNGARLTTINSKKPGASTYDQHLEFTKNRYLNPVKNEPLPDTLAQFLRDRHEAQSGFVQCVADSEEEAEQLLGMLKSMHITHEFGGQAKTKLSSNGRQYVAQILMNPIEVEEEAVVMDRIMSAYK